jgi:hypothetical protein
MVRGEFAFLAIVLPKAVLSKKRTKTILCQQVIPQANPGGAGPIGLVTRPRRHRQGAWFQTSGGVKGGLTGPSQNGCKIEVFFHNPSCEVSY